MAVPKQPNVERTGPLAGHIKRGKRIFLPPLAAIDVLHMGDWVWLEGEEDTEGSAK